MSAEEPRRQRVVRVAGQRRARLTPAPGAGEEPRPEASAPPPAPDGETGGANDERMRREKPPHY